MKVDLYLRAVLTVIAGALVYLCVVLTPSATVLAQQPGQIVGAPVPGVSTGPAEMVIVGWRSADVIPVAISRGEVRVTGRVETEPAENSVFRTTLIGWEERGAPRNPGLFQPFVEATGQSLPVKPRTP
jgi:hypothetical protein